MLLKNTALVAGALVAGPAAVLANKRTFHTYPDTQIAVDIHFPFKLNQIMLKTPDFGNPEELGVGTPDVQKGIIQFCRKCAYPEPHDTERNCYRMEFRPEGQLDVYGDNWEWVAGGRAVRSARVGMIEDLYFIHHYDEETHKYVFKVHQMNEETGSSEVFSFNPNFPIEAFTLETKGDRIIDNVWELENTIVMSEPAISSKCQEQYIPCGKLRSDMHDGPQSGLYITRRNDTMVTRLPVNGIIENLEISQALDDVEHNTPLYDNPAEIAFCPEHVETIDVDECWVINISRQGSNSYGSMRITHPKDSWLDYIYQWPITGIVHMTNGVWGLYEHLSIDFRNKHSMRFSQGDNVLFEHDSNFEIAKLFVRTVPSGDLTHHGRNFWKIYAPRERCPLVLPERWAEFVPHEEHDGPYCTSMIYTKFGPCDALINCHYTEGRLTGFGRRCPKTCDAMRDVYVEGMCEEHAKSKNMADRFQFDAEGRELCFQRTIHTNNICVNFDHIIRKSDPNWLLVFRNKPYGSTLRAEEYMPTPEELEEETESSCSDEDEDCEEVHGIIDEYVEIVAEEERAAAAEAEAEAQAEEEAEAEFEELVAETEAAEEADADETEVQEPEAEVQETEAEVQETEAEVQEPEVESQAAEQTVIESESNQVAPEAEAEDSTEEVETLVESEADSDQAETE